MIPLFSNSVTTPSIPVSAAAGNRYCQMLVILEEGKGIEVSNRLNLIVPDFSPFCAKLHTVLSGSFHVHPRSMSNPKRLVCAAPANTSALVNLHSPGNQRVIFAVGHSFTTPSIPVNLTLCRPGLTPRVCAISLVITDICAPVSMRNSINIFQDLAGMAMTGSEWLSESH